MTTHGEPVRAAWGAHEDFVETASQGRDGGVRDQATSVYARKTVLEIWLMVSGERFPNQGTLV